MIVVTAGGRDNQDRALVFAVLDHVRVKIGRRFECLAHGACGVDAMASVTIPILTWNGIGLIREKLRGADRWADEWSEERGVPCARYPAAWTLLGASAGPRRNKQMAALRPGLVLLFEGNAGTASMLAQARNHGVHHIACVVTPNGGAEGFSFAWDAYHNTLRLPLF